MDTKFTPGPWEIDLHGKGIGRHNQELFAIQAADYFGTMRWVVDRVRGGSKEQTRANAHLIAAAPTMLGVLQEVFEEFDNRYDGADDSRTKWMGELLEKSRWVIHKATGGAA